MAVAQADGSEPAAHKPWRTLGLVFLVATAGYLALKLIPQTLEYMELRRNLSRGKHVA